MILGNLFPDAELLSIMYEVVVKFKAMKNKNILIYLNHTSLLKAIMMRYGINYNKFISLYSVKASFTKELLILYLEDNMM